jgi:hypothetical protein
MKYYRMKIEDEDWEKLRELKYKTGETYIDMFRKALKNYFEKMKHYLSDE